MEIRAAAKRRRLFQRSDNGPQAHLLRQAMRSASLFVVEHRDQRTSGYREPLHGGAVEYNLHDSMADPVHDAG
jgi:hypothetical protein